MHLFSSPSSSNMPPPKNTIPWYRFGLSLLLMVVVLGLGGGAYVGLSALKKQPQARIPLPKIYVVETYSVKRQNLREQIRSFGTARADHEVVISAQVAGEVISFSPRLKSLEVGQFIYGPKVASKKYLNSQKGEILLNIDPEVFQQQVEQATKRLAVDDASMKRLLQEEKNNASTLKKAKDDYNHYLEEFKKVKNLFDTKIASASQLTRAKLELAKYEQSVIQRQNEKEIIPIRKLELKAQKESHQNDLKMAQLNLEHSTVFAPMSGTIREVMVDLGSFVRAGEPLLKLTDTSHIEIPVPVTLSDYAKVEQLLRHNKMIPVRIAAHETASYHRTGRIMRIAPVANTATRTVNLFVEVQNKEAALQQDRLQIHGSLSAIPASDAVAPILPGMFLHARIEGPILKNVMILPRETILHGRVFVVGELDLKQELKRLENQLQILRRSSKTNTKREQAKIERQKSMINAELKELPEKQQGKVKVARERKVQIERTLQTFVIIHSGLQPGEQVVTSNLDIMHDGARLRIESARTLDDELKKQRIPIIRPLTKKDVTARNEQGASSGG